MARTATLLFLQRFARRASGIVVIIGAAAVLVWIVQVALAKTFVPALVPMNPVIAGLLILCGLSLRLLITGREGDRIADGFGWTLGVLVTLFGAAKVAEHLFAVDFGFDRWFAQWLGPIESMSVFTALALLLSGIGLMIFDLEAPPLFRPAQACFIVVGIFALFALIGYAYKILPVSVPGNLHSMSIASALGFAFLSAAALAAQGDRGVMRVLTSDTSGGAMARRFLPAAIFIPFVLGGILLLGEQGGLFSTAFGVSFFVVANVLVFAALIWWNARLLYTAGLERARAERRLAIQYAVTKVIAESLTVSEAIRRILQSACEALNWPAGALWTVDERTGMAHCSEFWHQDRPELAEFAEASRKSTIAKGTGLPGEAWEDGHPVWMEDVAKEGALLRVPLAARAGLRGGLAFPVRCEQMTFGVMEFFSHETGIPDKVLLEMLDSTGSQIGQFIERKRAEDQLRQTTSELARSNTDLQQFAYIASHDLTEPLRMVRSYLELLAERNEPKLDSEAQEFVHHALDGARRMQGLMADLLAYARVDSKKRNFERVDANAIADAAVSNLKVAIEENNAVIEREPLPVIIGDPVQLTQVFQNLIGNALKFRGKNDPRIQISARKENGEWIFRIRDNGIGIDKKNFDRIFVLFQRLHTRQEYPGTGMGLAICKKIIERHGGRIWLESKAGDGSTFHFTVPALREAETSSDGGR